MRNIEEDIEKIKQLNNLLKFFKTHRWIPDLSREIITNGTIEAIEHMLTEREADKKRIKELEEALLKVKDKNIKLFINSKNSIPKQKIKKLMKERLINLCGIDFVSIEQLELLLQESEDK